MQGVIKKPSKSKSSSAVETKSLDNNNNSGMEEAMIEKRKKKRHNKEITEKPAVDETEKKKDSEKSKKKKDGEITEKPADDETKHEKRKKKSSSGGKEENVEVIEKETKCGDEECKKKKKKRKRTDDSLGESQQREDTASVVDKEEKSVAEKRKKKSSRSSEKEEEAKNGKKKEKERESGNKGSEQREGEGESIADNVDSSVGKRKKKREENKGKSVASASENNSSGDDYDPTQVRKRQRRVKFNSKVEVFSSGEEEEEGGEEFDVNTLIRGKRFSEKEDQLIRDAVFEYIETHQLGENGLHMVLNGLRYPRVRGCWKEIATSLPWRPVDAVSYRGHIIFERSEKRGFSAEEYETIRRFHAAYGPKWKKLAGTLGAQRTHVKDAWRLIKLPNKKKGKWSQEEYQSLFDLVNLDLRMKAFQEKNDKHGMLRENIAWEAISEKLSTRTMGTCCTKWYAQLTSPLVRQGEWADADDYRLVDALQRLDACCAEDVDWDSLLKNRSGEFCRKRWDQMVRHIGGYRETSFIEQVDVISKRYSVDMLQYRE